MTTSIAKDADPNTVRKRPGGGGSPGSRRPRTLSWKRERTGRIVPVQLRAPARLVDPDFDGIRTGACTRGQNPRSGEGPRLAVDKGLVVKALLEHPRAGWAVDFDVDQSRRRRRARHRRRDRHGRPRHRELRVNPQFAVPGTT